MAKVFGSHCLQLVCTSSDVCRQIWRFSCGEKQSKQLKKSIPEMLHHVGMVKVVNKNGCNGNADLV